jgi:hypothetical protein
MLALTHNQSQSRACCATASCLHTNHRRCSGAFWRRVRAWVGPMPSTQRYFAHPPGYTSQHTSISSFARLPAFLPLSLWRERDLSSAAVLCSVLSFEQAWPLCEMLSAFQGVSLGMRQDGMCTTTRTLLLVVPHWALTTRSHAPCLALHHSDCR